MSAVIGRKKVTHEEYKRALELARSAPLDHEAAEYWQVCRYYRGQVSAHSDVDKALTRIRATAN